MPIRSLAITVFVALMPTYALAAGGPISGNAETRFIVYYGNDFSGATMDALTEADVLVVHPGVDALTPAVVAELQSKGVGEVLCYISVGEDAKRNPVHPGDGSGPLTHNGLEPIPEYAGVASFYVDMNYNRDEARYERDYMPDTNGTYGSRYVFPNAEWRHVLDHQRIGGSAAYPLRNDAGVEQILGKRSSDLDLDRSGNFGCDGLFMDTLATASPFMSAGSYAWAAEEMSYTVELIRERYPDAYLMANGVGYYLNPSAYNADFDVRPYAFTIRPFIDAVAWESYRISPDTGLESPYFFSHENTYAPKVIAESMRPDGFGVFTIEYAGAASPTVVQDTVEAVSRRNGWTSYFAGDHLLRDVGRHIGDLYLAPDTEPPIWGVTGSSTVPPRIGVQGLVRGENYGELVVQWDVARDQTGPISFDVEVSQAPDMSTALLYEAVTTRVGRGWAENPYAASAYETTIEGLPEGDYYVRVRARDGLGQREQNENVMMISLGLSPVSNRAEGIVIDGDVDDWFDMVPLGADPDDLVSSLDDFDATMLWMADRDGDLYVAIDVEGTFDRGAQTLLYIDADRDLSTGYSRDLSIGADFLVRDQRVYAYQGDDNRWNWSLEGSAPLGPGEDAEMVFPLRWLGDPDEFEVVFLTLTKPRDCVPDSGDTAGGERYLYAISDPGPIGPETLTAVPLPQPPPPPPVGPLQLRAASSEPEPTCDPKHRALRGQQGCSLRR